MTEDLRVRTVEPSDYDAWLPLWEGYNAFYGRSGETALPAAVTQSTWGRFFDEAEPVHGLVAVATGRLVGLAHYLFHRNTIRIEPTCYLQDLYADPDFRAGGVGRALMETFFGRAHEAGWVKSEMCWIICLDAAPPRWVSRGRFVPRILRSVRL